MMMRYLSERSSRFPRNPTVSYVEHPLLEWFDLWIAGARSRPLYLRIQLREIEGPPDRGKGLVGLVTKWIEQRFPKPCVAGSIPAGGTHAIPILLSLRTGGAVDEGALF